MSDAVSYAKIAAKANEGEAESPVSEHHQQQQGSLSTEPVNDANSEKATPEINDSSAIESSDVTADSTVSPSGGSDKQKKKKQPTPKPQPVYTPAPVPTINPWSSRTGGSNGASATLNGADSPQSSTSSLSGYGGAQSESGLNDDANWPKPDTSATTPLAGGLSNGGNFGGAAAKVRPSKKEWVPFTPIVGSGGAKNANGNGNRSGKFSGHNHNSHHHSHHHHSQANGHGSKHGAAAASEGHASHNQQSPNLSQSPNGSGSRDRGSSPESDGGRGGSNSGPYRSTHRHKKSSGQQMSGNTNGLNNNGSHQGGGRKYYRDEYRRNKAHAAAQNGVAHPGMTGFHGAGNFNFAGPMNPLEITIGLIAAQLDYYMSVENMCKDMFLRRHMNSQGYVPLKVLANFNRIMSLTNGDYNLLLEASKWTQNGQVTGEKIRPVKEWENWVMPIGERAEAGKDESTSDSEGEDKALQFNAAAAVPFVPKTELKTKAAT